MIQYPIERENNSDDEMNGKDANNIISLFKLQFMYVCTHLIADSEEDEFFDGNDAGDDVRDEMANMEINDGTTSY